MAEIEHTIIATDAHLCVLSRLGELRRLSVLNPDMPLCLPANGRGWPKPPKDGAGRLFAHYERIIREHESELKETAPHG
jgi:hypothetical protein